MATKATQLKQPATTKATSSSKNSAASRASTAAKAANKSTNDVKSTGDSPSVKGPTKAATARTTENEPGDESAKPSSRSSKNVEVEQTGGSVSISPNLPPIPGNTVTFYAKAPKDAGRLTAKISGPRGPWFANLTEGGDGDLRVSKIIEVPGTITVEFFNDGKSFAKGSWEV